VSSCNGMKPYSDRSASRHRPWRTGRMQRCRSAPPRRTPFSGVEQKQLAEALSSTGQIDGKPSKVRRSSGILANRLVIGRKMIAQNRRQTKCIGSGSCIGRVNAGFFLAQRTLVKRMLPVLVTRDNSRRESMPRSPRTHTADAALPFRRGCAMRLAGRWWAGPRYARIWSFDRPASRPPA